MLASRTCVAGDVSAMQVHSNAAATAVADFALTVALAYSAIRYVDMGCCLTSLSTRPARPGPSMYGPFCAHTLADGSCEHRFDLNNNFSFLLPGCT